MTSKVEKCRLKSQQEKFQAILSDLLKDEDNKYCEDCDAKGPRWAAWNLGIFLCIRCAGIHRNLGVHISRVKSVNLDTWTPEQMAMMVEVGNSRARAIYEANIPIGFRRPQTDSALETFIRSKYEQKIYIAHEWVPVKPVVPKEWLQDGKVDRRKFWCKPVNISPISMSQPVTASEPVSMVAPLPAGKRAVSEAVQVEPNNIPSKTCPIGNQHLQSGSSTCDLLNLEVEPQKHESAHKGDLVDEMLAYNYAAGLVHNGLANLMDDHMNGPSVDTLFGNGSNCGGKVSDGKNSAKDSIMALYGNCLQQSHTSRQALMNGVPASTVGFAGYGCMKNPCARFSSLKCIVPQTLLSKSASSALSFIGPTKTDPTSPISTIHTSLQCSRNEALANGLVTSASGNSALADTNLIDFSDDPCFDDKSKSFNDFLACIKLQPNGFDDFYCGMVESSLREFAGGFQPKSQMLCSPDRKTLPTLQLSTVGNTDLDTSIPRHTAFPMTRCNSVTGSSSGWQHLWHDGNFQARLCHPEMYLYPAPGGMYNSMMQQQIFAEMLPMQQGMMGHAMQQGMMGRPMQQGMVGRPMQQGMVGQPMQQGMMGVQQMDPIQQQQLSFYSTQQQHFFPMQHQQMYPIQQIHQPQQHVDRMYQCVNPSAFQQPMSVQQLQQQMSNLTVGGGQMSTGQGDAHGGVGQWGGAAAVSSGHTLSNKLWQ